MKSKSRNQIKAIKAKSKKDSYDWAGFEKRRKAIEAEFEEVKRKGNGSLFEKDQPKKVVKSDKHISYFTTGQKRDYHKLQKLALKKSKKNQ